MNEKGQETDTRAITELQTEARLWQSASSKRKGEMTGGHEIRPEADIKKARQVQAVD